jgi:hypothetical protein
MISDFGIRICFGFRISDFGFRLGLRLLKKKTELERSNYG